MNRTLFFLTAMGTVLSGLVPFSKYEGGNFFDAGAAYVVWILIPVALLILAAIGSGSNGSGDGLGGGAALTVACTLGPLAIMFWKLLPGEFAGPGLYLMTATAILGLFTAIAALGTLSDGRGSPVFGLVLVAAFLMSLGTTLIPPEYSGYGMSWAAYNGFGEGRDALIGFAGELVVWGPLLAVIIGVSKRGRYGAMYALGGSCGMLWLIVVVQTKMLGDSEMYDILRPKLHPVAVVGAVLLAILLLVALSVAGQAAPVNPAPANDGYTGSVANPSRWATDPLARHELRYWDGANWTEHVADAGVASTDDGRSPLSPPVAPPTVAVPVARAAGVALSPAPVPIRSPFGAPAVPDVEPTRPRQQDGAASPVVASIAELLFDSGRRVTVTTPLVIGRAPRARAELPAAALFPLEDRTMSVSATHLLVGPHPAGVWAEDTGSTNGSIVAHNSGETQQMMPQVRVTVPYGAEIRFGERSLRVVPAVNS